MTEIDARPCLWHEGMQVTVAVDGSSTDGARAVCVLVAEAGARLPRRRHAREDVTVTVCSGAAAVTTPTGPRMLSSGQRLRVSRGEAFGVEVTSLAPTVLALEFEPAGFETTLQAISSVSPEEALDPDDVAALLAAAGVTLLPRVT